LIILNEIIGLDMNGRIYMSKKRQKQNITCPRLKSTVKKKPRPTSPLN
jgi:hypothetical protein